MAVKDWSTTAGNNVQANTGINWDEGQAPSTVNDSARSTLAAIRAEWGSTSLTATATMAIGAATGGFIHVCTDAGKSISQFDTVSAGIRRTLLFDVAATLVHDGTKLIMPGDASIALAAGSVAQVVSLGSGNWQCYGLLPNGGNVRLDGADQVVTGGVIVTSNDLGTITSGTVTPDPGDRPLQHYTNGGAHTLAPSSNAGTTVVDITNNASAGAITTASFTLVTGAFTTTNAHKFRCFISIGNGGSLLQIQALQ